MADKNITIDINNLSYVDYLWTKKSDDGSSIEGIRLSPLNLPTDVVYTADLPTALPNPKALTFGSKTYNGSTAQTITASDLGALTSHQDISGKVNKSGDTMTGSLTIASGSSINVSQYNDAGGVSLMNNGGGTATQFGSSQRPARLFSSNQPEWWQSGASKGTLALKSDIPTVNNATLTIQQNSKNVATFTANSSTNATANIIVPSKTSELTNDAGFTTNTGTITEIKVNGTSKGTSGPVNLTNMVTFASSQTANVAGVNKTTYTYNQPAGDSNTNISNGSAYFPEGIIMGGTAASAGLITRGICGVATPDATTGACAKENLYLNYDGNNIYQSGRQVVIQAGSVGTHYGNNLYQYAAARGDAVKNYCDATYAAKSHTHTIATATTGITASFAGTAHSHPTPTITVNQENTSTGAASATANVYSSIGTTGAAISTSYDAATKTLTIGINSFPTSFGTTSVATGAHTHTYNKVTGATAGSIAAIAATGTITITDNGHTHGI